MKEKRILTMFITSAIALVVSLVVTFGIVLTLADPVVATGLTRYEYRYGGTNSSIIKNDGNALMFASDVIYTPSGSIVWKDKTEDINDDKFIVDAQPDAKGNTNYSTVVRYGNESYSSKIKVMPIRISNTTNAEKTFTLTVKATGDATLLSFTNMKVFEYDSPANFVDKALNTEETLTTIPAGAYKDYLIVVYTDDAGNLGGQIAYGTARLNLNVVIK